MQLCYQPIILHFIIHFQSSSSSVTSKSPAHKFSTQNTTAFDEARQFRFSVITFLALENKCSLATDVPAAVWRLLLLTDTFGSSSPTKTVDFGYAKVSARRGKLPAVDSWSVATRRREWQTTPIQHCWTSRRSRRSVCPTGSTPVWGRLWMQQMAAVRCRCWLQPPAPWNWSWRPLPSLCRRHQTTTPWIWDRRPIVNCCRPTLIAIR